jgi:hypothetical protein
MNQCQIMSVLSIMHMVAIHITSYFIVKYCSMVINLLSLQNVSFWSCHFWQPLKRLTCFWSGSCTHTSGHCGLYSIHPNHHISAIFSSVKHSLPTKVHNLCPKGVLDISFSMLVYDNGTAGAEKGRLGVARDKA